MISIHSCAECNAMSSNVHSGHLRAVDRLHLTDGNQIEMTYTHKIFIELLSIAISRDVAQYENRKINENKIKKSIQYLLIVDNVLEL